MVDCEKCPIKEKCQELKPKECPLFGVLKDQVERERVDWANV